LCLHRGVEELLSADRDFSRFRLPTPNPLLQARALTHGSGEVEVAVVAPVSTG
jgi:hypothetical protein